MNIINKAIKMIGSTVKLAFALFLEFSDIMRKDTIVNKLELKLMDIEYNHILMNNDKSKEELDFFLRLLKATKGCPAIILSSEIDSLLASTNNGKDISEAMTLAWVKRLEIYNVA